jgi:diguanylate cyclase (GGDEF)-like protein/PAS domain S-box-containing protein
MSKSTLVLPTASVQKSVLTSPNHVLDLLTPAQARTPEASEATMWTNRQFLMEPAREPEPASAIGEILVVDDTPEMLSFFFELLDEEGYAVRTAPNGELALWTVRSRLPDLILLDVRMPDMDGFEVCRRLKADAGTAHIPVIFLSAHYELADKIRAFRVGGADFIEKPCAGEEVLQRVATQIQLARVTAELKVEKALLEEKVLQRTEQLEMSTALLRDEVNARRLAESNLRIAAGAFEASLSGMFVTAADETIVAINPALSAIIGYSADECLGRHQRLFNSDKHDEQFFHSIRASILATGNWTGEVWNRRKDGNVFPSLQTVSAIRDASGQTINYVSAIFDLSETKDAQVLIDFLTGHDRLTGLPNRVMVRDRLAQLQTNAAQDGETLAVISINLDRFRFINDFHGHAAGDEILKWVAQQLRDAVSSQDNVFREGGDEFIVVRREPGGMLGLRLLVDTILANLNAEVDVDGVLIATSASAGIAVYPSDGATLDELTNNAMIAMSRVKQLGGESHAFFTESLDQGARDRFDMAQRLRHALGNNEFSVKYQPQIDARNGRIVAAEALLRWDSPGLGAVSPARFIPVAEQTGRIVEIGAWVLESVCTQIARWHADGHGYVKVAVNLSAVQFMREDLCERVKSALHRSEIPPQYLELEITEGMIIEDVDKAIATMRALRDIGVTISLDDFGTGYSSLSYLKQFPIDYLKIDQSFVRDLFVEQDADAIVLSIIGLAHHLRLKVVAEGVETEAQRDFLVRHGCDLLQGYLFSKPVAADELIAKTNIRPV